MLQIVLTEHVDSEELSEGDSNYKEPAAKHQKERDENYWDILWRKKAWRISLTRLKVCEVRKISMQPT